MAEPTEARWPILIHQIPPKPNHLRVKVWRRLQRFGATAVKEGFFNTKGVSIPVAVSVFPGEQYEAPRSWTEREPRGQGRPLCGLGAAGAVLDRAPTAFRSVRNPSTVVSSNGR